MVADEHVLAKPIIYDYDSTGSLMSSVTYIYH